MTIKLDKAFRRAWIGRRFDSDPQPPPPAPPKYGFMPAQAEGNHILNWDGPSSGVVQPLQASQAPGGFGQIVVGGDPLAGVITALSAAQVDLTLLVYGLFADWYAFDPNAWIWVITEGLQSVPPAGLIDSWPTENGAVSLVQGVSANRPTLGPSGRVVFNGTDSFMTHDAGGSRFHGAHTLFFGFDEPNLTTTTARTALIAAATGSSTTTRQVSMNFSRPDIPNATRQRILFGDDSSSVAVSLMSVVTPYDMGARVPAFGSADLVRIYNLLTNSSTAIDTTTRPSGPSDPFDYFTIGASRRGAGPTVNQFWQGSVRYLAVGSFEYSLAQLDIARGCLVNAGLIV